MEHRLTAKEHAKSAPVPPAMPLEAEVLAIAEKVFIAIANAI